MKNLLAFLTITFPFFCLINPAIGQDPIKEIEGIELQQSIFEAVDKNRVLVLTSEADAKSHLSEENFEKLAKSVDFETQRVVILAWRGSGGDSVTYDVAESWPEQISIRFKRGMTRDLRPHQKVFALRSNVSCSVEGNPVDLNRKVKSDAYARVEIKGTLEQDGEIYSVALDGSNLTLDLQDDAELMESAKSLLGKSVLVTGNLVGGTGDHGSNWMVKVKTLKSSD